MDSNRLESLRDVDADSLNVLLLGTGSVASVKIPLMVEALLHVKALTSRFSWYPDFIEKYKNVKVQVALTKASLKFLNRNDIEKLGVRIWTDNDEWAVRVI